MPTRTALLIAFVAALIFSQPAFACSFTEDFNPVATSDVIVGGWLTEWHPLSNTNAGLNLTAIQIRMDVKHIFKGQVSEEFHFVDRNSLDTYAADEWVGSSGGCGTFHADPTGHYAILGLTKDPTTGVYHSSLLLLFYLGNEPAGTDYEQALDYLQPLAPELPPSTGVSRQGNDPLTKTTLLSWVLLASLLLLVGGLLVGFSHYRRRQR